VLRRGPVRATQVKLIHYCTSSVNRSDPAPTRMSGANDPAQFQANKANFRGYTPAKIAAAGSPSARSF
jgi:hypothetical protein